MSYEDLQRKYAVKEEEYEVMKRLDREDAFWLLDAHLEGMDRKPSEEEAEAILDDYLNEMYEGDFMCSFRWEAMENAIASVMEV